MSRSHAAQAQHRVSRPQRVSARPSRLARPVPMMQLKACCAACERGFQKDKETTEADVRVQPKLIIGSPNEPAEREADRVAEQVMRMPEPASLRQPLDAEEEEEDQERIQPKRLDSVVRRQLLNDDEELHKKPASSLRPPTRPDLRVRIATLRACGQPLTPSIRSFFEPRFGYDFGSVRVHADPTSAELAERVNARAFTVGRHVVFGQGQYVPNTTDGGKLLAHELTHVVQQLGADKEQAAVSVGRFEKTPEATSTCSVQNGMRGQPGNGQVSIGRSPAREAPVLQRLVRRSLVTCPAGQNPFSADRRASTLLTQAMQRIDSAQAERAANPAHADVLAVRAAMWRAFRLNPGNANNWTQGAPHFGLPLIRGRLEIARNYIDSVVFTMNCCLVGGACPMPCGICLAGEEAFTCGGNATNIALCPPFWAHGLNQRGRVLAHEVLHINFNFVADWAQPDRANAHCYAQFVALLNGFNSPAGFRCH